MTPKMILQIHGIKSTQAKKNWMSPKIRAMALNYSPANEEMTEPVPEMKMLRMRQTSPRVLSSLTTAPSQQPIASFALSDIGLF